MTGARLLAWSAHFVTALGAVAGFFALPAIARGDFRTAFAWLAFTIILDGVDGTYARAVHVKEVLPRFDGHGLDYCIDFVNFVLTPAYLLYAANLIEPRFASAAVTAVMLVSSYHYGNVDALTRDGYFRKFPAWWNVVVFYLYLLSAGRATNLALVAIFCALHFIPIKWIAASRTKRQKALNVAAACGVAVTSVAIIELMPNVPAWLIWLSVGFAAYLTAASVVHTFLPEGTPI
jgi:phosphatidylcholine synthase